MSRAVYLRAFVVLLAAAASVHPASAQEADGSGEDFDPSKPTNFYTLLSNNVEANIRGQGGNIVGYRGELIYSPSEAHLILAELPLLYNTGTKRFGLGDVRTRYFYLPYKNYDRVVGAAGPSIDVFWPTGRVSNGLGSESFVISPGFTLGLIFADWIQAFPVISYQLVTKSMSASIPPEDKKVTHGINLQAIIPIVFHPQFFMQVTPIGLIQDVTRRQSTRYIQELLAQYQPWTKVAINAFWRGNFTDKDQTVRLGVTVFFL